MNFAELPAGQVPELVLDSLRISGPEWETFQVTHATDHAAPDPGPIEYWIDAYDGSDTPVGGGFFTTSTADLSAVLPPGLGVRRVLIYAFTNSIRVSSLAFTPRPACSDGVDNDGDGWIDFPADLDCADPGGDELGAFTPTVSFSDLPAQQTPALVLPQVQVVPAFQEPFDITVTPAPDEFGGVGAASTYGPLDAYLEPGEFIALEFPVEASELQLRLHRDPETGADLPMFPYFDYFLEAYRADGTYPGGFVPSQIGTIPVSELFGGQTLGRLIVGTATGSLRVSGLSLTSLPECSDGVDNDGDGWVDYPDDPDCVDAADTSELLDPDGDGIADSLDNCPLYPNADQSDVGGAGAVPDGIGDACQCGDADQDGQLTNADVHLIQDHIQGQIGLDVSISDANNSGTLSYIDRWRVSWAVRGWIPTASLTRARRPN